ncbi:MAG TPA: hypothetical protein VFZ34_19315, partial [Blastocatellia bacterium]|nr:hypothetical protein [Blastocatellia bacterium]
RPVTPQPASDVPTVIDPERDVLPRARLALHLADLIYLLPDLDSKDKALKARAYFTAFKEKMPADLTLAMSESDPKTGLRVAVFKPQKMNVKTATATPRAHLIIAIAGTEGARDGIADFSFGRSQCNHLLTLIDNLFTSHALPPKPEIIITGHSLGGGLAQAVAWYLEKNLPERKIQPNLWLFTFNAFGAQELIRKQEKAFTPEDCHLTYAANYFVRGEPISQLGTHLGPTFELVPEEAEKKSKFKLPRFDGFGKHRIEYVNQLASADSTIFIKAQEVRTERKFYASLLSGVMNKTSGFTKLLPGFTFWITSKELPKVMTQMYQSVLHKEALSREDREYFDWLETTTERLFPTLETKMKKTLNELIEAKDQTMLRFYDLKVVKASRRKASSLLRVLKKEFE